MKFRDQVKVPDGIFELRAYNKQGELIDHVIGHNIVVNDGREALARLLGNDQTQNWYVDTMKFGDGGHNPATVTEMIPVDVTDDDLFGTIHISKDVTSSTAFPASRQVQFVATVENNEGNGASFLEYSEAGLYYNGGTQMFAHKVFGYIVKNDTIRLVATWTFVF